MKQPTIVAYLNPYCGWTQGVISVLHKHGLEFEYRDVAANPADFEEMMRKTGQTSAPCVEIDGHMLADVGGTEVEAWMRQNGVIGALRSGQQFE